MGKICMFCLEEYKNDDIMTPFKTSDAGLYQECPKRACEGKVYTIDDSLVPTITILNTKGYPTHSSCGGHHLENDTECYIEFTEDVKSLPQLPEGFKLRMRSVDGKSRLAIYRKPKSEDPIDQFSDLMEFAEILYDWALDLEFNIQGLDIVFVNLDMNDSPFGTLDYVFGSMKDNKDEKPKEASKKKLDVDKLKETAPKGSIKLKNAEEPKTEEDAPIQDEKKEPPKKKRGRPRKNQDNNDNSN